MRKQVFDDIRNGVRSDIPGISIGPEDETGCQLCLSGNKAMVFVELLEHLGEVLRMVEQDTDTSLKLKELYNRMIA